VRSQTITSNSNPNPYHYREEMAGLNCVRSALGCAVLNGRIYVAGGYGPNPVGSTNNHKLSTVEEHGARFGFGTDFLCSRMLLEPRPCFGLKPA
jgi:hypothetical protein